MDNTNVQMNVHRNNSAIRKKFIINALFFTLMLVIALILIFPFFYMVMRSLMTEQEVINPTVLIFPAIPQFSNYVRIFTNEGYLSATLNTLKILAFNIIAIPLSASLVAFSFAKLKWIGRDFMFAAMLVTMMLPGIVTQVPLFIMYAKIGWLNTLYPFTIPNLFGGGAFNIFLIRQFMLGIPREMDEAAKIDGANAFKRYLFITMPLCSMILIYLAVNIFIGTWGDYYGPLVFFISPKAPYTLAYRVFVDSTEGAGAAFMSHIRMAGGVFMTIPPLILFALFQKQLIEGVATMGIKG